MDFTPFLEFARQPIAQIGAAALLGVGLGALCAGLAARPARKRAEAAAARLTDELERVGGETHALREANERLERALDETREAEFEARKDAAVALQDARVRAETLSARDAELADVRALGEELRVDLERMRTRAAEREAQWTEERDGLVALRAEVQKEFKSLASDALKANNATFVDYAAKVFEKHEQKAETDGAARRKALDELIGPMRESLKQYQTDLKALEAARLDAYGGIKRELKLVAEAQGDVRAETSRLVNALRASPKTRGRWGEKQLENILELSGMSPYCDFQTEHHVAAEDGAIRPDVVVRLPAGRRIIIDAKTSLDAYLAAYETPDDAEREAQLAKHAQQIRAHMQALATKKYHEKMEATLDFTVMFVPGENFFSAALERDPNLFNDAFERNVVITTPTTLLPLMKSVAYGWRQEALAGNAREVEKLGKELYKRLTTMGDHVAGLGKGLEQSVKKYNAFVSSLERNVITSAKRFEDLKVAPDASLDLPQPVGGEVAALNPAKHGAGLVEKGLAAPVEETHDDVTGQKDVRESAISERDSALPEIDKLSA